jgi:hypothetical protein
MLTSPARFHGCVVSDGKCGHSGDNSTHMSLQCSLLCLLNCLPCHALYLFLKVGQMWMIWCTFAFSVLAEGPHHWLGRPHQCVQMPQWFSSWCSLQTVPFSALSAGPGHWPGHLHRCVHWPDDPWVNLVVGMEVDPIAGMEVDPVVGMGVDPVAGMGVGCSSQYCGKVVVVWRV